jgi:hypothetical protein
MSEAETVQTDSPTTTDVLPNAVKDESVEPSDTNEEEKKDTQPEDTENTGTTAVTSTVDESTKRGPDEDTNEPDVAKKLKIDIGSDKDEPDPIPAALEGTAIFNDADVLSGRGGGTNVHPGNRSFRDLINMHRRAYLKARKNDKPAISRAIVRSIRDANGRFMRKEEKTGLWFEIGDDAAREKTSQALRQRAPEMRKLLFDTEREEARSVAEDHMRQQRIMMGMPPDAPPGMPMPPMAYANPAYFQAMVANGGKPPGPPQNAQDPNYQQAMFQAAMMNNNMNRFPPPTNTTAPV